MVCATEVYQWFKELLPFNRIDFLCSLMQLCLPSELRFVGTLLDDMNNKDYANLREAEDRSNSPNEFRQYPFQPFSGECVRKLCLNLSLLKSTNQKVGQIIYEILQIHSDFANDSVKIRNDFSSEILLLYALASFHPAFTFENRCKIGKNFKKMLINFEDTSDDFSNKNNSCCYDVTYRNFNEIDKFKISIKDIKVDKHDANITLELITKEINRTNRSTTFTDIRKLINNVSEVYNGKSFSKLHNEINNLTRNGNFTTKNISMVLGMIIKFVETNNDNEDASVFLKDFFLNLPISHKKNKNYSNYKSANNSLETSIDEAENTSNNKKYIFQNNNFENPKTETTKKSLIDDNSGVSEMHKSAVVSVDKVLKDKLCSEDNDCDATNQPGTEINPLSPLDGKMQENVDSTISDNTNIQDLNPTIPVFQYCLPHYSLLPNAKSNSSLPQYPMYSNNSLDHASSSGQTSSNTIMRQLVPDTFILTHCPQRFLHFNTQISPFVLCPVNPVNFLPPSELNELFSSHRFPTATATNVSPSPSVVNKLPSSTPPRLQSNNQKSAPHPTNFTNGC